MLYTDKRVNQPASTGSLADRRKARQGQPSSLLGKSARQRVRSRRASHGDTVRRPEKEANGQGRRIRPTSKPEEDASHRGAARLPGQPPSPSPPCLPGKLVRQRVRAAMRLLVYFSLKGSDTNTDMCFNEMVNEQKAKEILVGDAVQKVSSQDIPIQNGRTIDTALAWITKNPIGIVQTVIGAVEVSKGGIDNSFGHTRYKNKVFVLPAIRSILEHGAYIGHAPDLRKLKKENYYFATPIEIDGERKIVFIRTVENIGNPNTFYVHEVFTEEEIKKSEAMRPAAISKKSLHGKASDLYRSILYGALSVK